MKFKFNFLLFTTLLFLTIELKAQEVSTNSFDGPYVLYRGEQIIVKELNYTPEISVTEKSFHLKEKQKVVVKVKFSDASDKNFEVKLKTTIQQEPSVWAQPDKILFLSDIEGEFDALRDLLLANKVINKKYEWIFDKGNLVIYLIEEKRFQLLCGFYIN